MSRKSTKIGFDLDGVLLYNPARIIRRPIVAFKHLFIPKREHTFLVPKNQASQTLWKFFHLSSFTIAPGFDNLENVIKKKQIKAYIITARYNFLKDNTMHWYKKLNQNNKFIDIYMNKKNQQPHLFKKKAIEDLKLDYFVEDNFDIVSYLYKHSTVCTYWIYNIFDYFQNYPYKFTGLSHVTEALDTTL